MTVSVRGGNGRQKQRKRNDMKAPDTDVRFGEICDTSRSLVEVVVGVPKKIFSRRVMRRFLFDVLLFVKESA